MGQGAFIPESNGAIGGGAGTASAISSIAGGTTVATGPLVSFANSNNVSFGVSGNTITASVVPDAGIGVAVPGTTLATGTAVFSNSNGVSFGINGSTITASVAAGATGNLGAISAAGSSVSSGTVVFANSTGVSFGMNGNTITASAGWPLIVGGYGGTRTVGGTVTFLLSDVPGAGGSWALTDAGDQFRVNFSVTGSHVISAGTTSASTGTIVFSNSNGVSFGLNGQTMTGSVAAGATATGNYGALAAGTQTATSGTVVLSNSNNITFGMSGSTRITAQMAAAANAAGTQTATSGTVAFVNSNGITFGMSGSTAITASVAANARMSLWSNGYGNLQTGSMSTNPAGDGASYFLSLQRVSFPSPMAVTRLEFIASLNANGSVGGNAATQAGVAQSFGLYTMNGSTASLASTFSHSYSYNNTTTASQSSNEAGQTGVRIRTMSLSTGVITPGEYLLAIAMSLTVASAGATSSRGITAYGGQFTTNLLYAGETTAVTRNYFDAGVFLLTAAATTATMPSSIHMSAINSAFTNPASIGAQLPFQPFLRLLGT